MMNDGRIWRLVDENKEHEVVYMLDTWYIASDLLSATKYDWSEQPWRMTSMTHETILELVSARGSVIENP